jgi:hypothetical protein
MLRRARETLFGVMAGLVPAISIHVARQCQFDRDARHKAGHDGRMLVTVILTNVTD